MTGPPRGAQDGCPLTQTEGHIETRWSDSLVVGADGVTLYQQRWLPPESPKGVVCLIHGFAEHSGRYARHAARLTAGSYAVEALDLRGHGKSEGKRGRVRDAEVLVEDVTQLIARLRRNEEYAHLPIFLWGQSLGATLAGLAALRTQSSIRGIVLCSPALQIGEPIVLQKLGLLMARILPNLPTKRLNRRLLSVDDNVVRESQYDPLNFHGFIRVGTAAEIVLSGRRLLATAGQLTLPLLIIHGTDDRLTLAVASARLYRLSRSDNKSLSLFKGMLHETFNEADGHQVIDRIVDFLDEQTH